MAHGSSSSLQQLSIVGRLKGSHAGQQTMEGEGLCGTEKTKGVQIHIEGGYSSGGNPRGLGYSPMEERLASICVSLRTKAKKATEQTYNQLLRQDTIYFIIQGFVHAT